jgi:hypothetical protein
MQNYTGYAVHWDSENRMESPEGQLYLAGFELQELLNSTRGNEKAIDGAENREERRSKRCRGQDLHV